MNELEVIAGGALCIAIAVGIMFSVAVARGGSFASRMAGIGVGGIALIAGLTLLMNAYRTATSMLLPVVAGAAFVGVAGGLLYRGARLLHHR